MAQRARDKNRRGLVLAVVVMTAVVMGIAAYTALFVALAMARLPNPLDEVRVRARFASEAGVAWARERLYDNTGDVLSQLSAPGAQKRYDSATEPMLRSATNGLRVIVTVTHVPTATGPEYAIKSTAGF